MQFDPEALKAAAESARRKSQAGSNVTDQLMPFDAALASSSPAEVDLRTNYMGLSLRCPVVASAGPLSQSVAGIQQLADGGVGAVVIYSLFEEQLRREAARNTAIAEQHAESFAEALSYFPDELASDQDPVNSYLTLVEQASRAVDVPVIASLNGSTNGGWTGTAKRMQDAGAAAIELNVYFVPGDMHHDAREVEQRHLEILASVKQAVSIPVAMKLSPYFSSFGHFAADLDAAGADALVLFNRFLQPDIDLGTLSFQPGFGLSSPSEGRLPRAWIAALRGRVKASLAATSGVETSEDVIKYLLAGADVVMTTAALLRHGPAYAQDLVDGLVRWLQANSLTLDKARGMLAQPESTDADLYARSGYVASIQTAKSLYGPREG